MERGGARSGRWCIRLSRGRRLRVHSERFVSLAQRHLACIRYEVTALWIAGRVVISSELVTPLANIVEKVERPDDRLAQPQRERVDGAEPGGNGAGAKCGQILPAAPRSASITTLPYRKQVKAGTVVGPDRVR